jgi:DNA-binding NtrC family response regulator
MSEERIIAIIEDDNLLSLVLKKQLEMEGIPTRIFSKAMDFIDFLSYDPLIILVLMDVKLKGDMNGIQLAALVPQHIPIIFCTGNSDVDLSGHPNQEQIKDILIKPVDIDQLMLKIRPLI